MSGIREIYWDVPRLSYIPYTVIVLCLNCPGTSWDVPRSVLHVDHTVIVLCLRCLGYVRYTGMFLGLSNIPYTVIVLCLNCPGTSWDIPRSVL